MLRFAVFAALGIAAAMQPAWSQTPPPPFATTKVDGTNNVYIFRSGGHQAMFVVTPAGVIVTDPIGYVRRDAPATYLAEIRKITDKPIKYVIYSHNHYDHIAGGKVFKDAGATFISHQRAKERIVQVKDPDTVVPDQTFRKQRTITLGGTVVELKYVGLNHSDSSLVMRLPKEKIIFAVDFIPVGSMPGRGMIDSYPLEWEASLKQVLAMDWDRLIPGHPGPGGRLGTKDDVRNFLAMMQDMSAEVRESARAGKCWDTTEKEVKLSKYEKVPGYEASLPMIVRRYCGLWGRGS